MNLRPICPTALFANPPSWEISAVSQATSWKCPFNNYQLLPLYSIVESVWNQEGREFLLIFSRQSGKNEAIAHLLVYLLNTLQRKQGNLVFAAAGDGIGRGLRRLRRTSE